MYLLLMFRVNSWEILKCSETLNEKLNFNLLLCDVSVIIKGAMRTVVSVIVFCHSHQHV